jgi:hypothetical protein
MVAFSWVGTPQKWMKIIKFGRHLVEGILPTRRLDQGIGRLQQKHYYINGLILNFNQSSRGQNFQHQISINQNCSKAQTGQTKTLPGPFDTKIFLLLDLSQSITLKHLCRSFIVTTSCMVNGTVAVKFKSCTLSNRQSTASGELPKDEFSKHL